MNPEHYRRRVADCQKTLASKRAHFNFLSFELQSLMVTKSNLMQKMLGTFMTHYDVARHTVTFNQTLGDSMLKHYDTVTHVTNLISEKNQLIERCMRDIEFLCTRMFQLQQLLPENDTQEQ